MKTTAHWKFQRFAGPFSRIFSSRLNPLYHLGDIAIAMFIIACATGVYLFFFYNVDPAQAYQSVEGISKNPFNAVIRSAHRYSSDLLVVFLLLHFLQTLFTGKYKRVLSWISGVISLLVILFIGVTGFILVWDEKGKLIGYLTARFFTALPIFDPAIAGSFISNNLDYVGGFFKVSLFGHVFFSVFLLIVLWLHVMRIARPKLFSPREIWMYTGIALLAACLIFPVKSDSPAQGTFIPYNTTFDWYYFFGYYLLIIFTVPVNWGIMIVSGIVVALVPFIARPKRKAPAVIDLDKCDACNRCAEDCPYGAIDMLIRNGNRKAILDNDKCISCGICLASCKEFAITMEGYPDLLKNTGAAKRQLTVVSCSQFAPVNLPANVSNYREQITCIGDLHSKEVEHLLAEKSEGVLLLGCEDCYHRLGKTWLTERLVRNRPPGLAKAVPQKRIELITANNYSEKALQDFTDLLQKPEADEAGAVYRIHDFLKANHALAAMLITLFFLSIPLLSNTRVSFFSKQEHLLVLSFKYISTPIEFREIKSDERQMQLGKPMVAKRSPVKVEVMNEAGEVIYTRQYVPRGLKQDIAIFVYDEIRTPQRAVSIRVTETAVKDKQIQLAHVTLSDEDGTIVTFVDGELKTLKKEKSAL